jgi:putative IMPACT (imprinted ancient) family translation regulator
VHAYGDAVKEVVARTPRAQKLLTHTVMVGFHYRLLEQIRLLVAAHHGQVLDEDFAAEITLTARFPVDYFADFQQSLLELSSGKLQAESGVVHLIAESFWSPRTRLQPPSGGSRDFR